MKPVYILMLEAVLMSFRTAATPNTNYSASCSLFTEQKSNPVADKKNDSGEKVVMASLSNWRPFGMRHKRFAARKYHRKGVGGASHLFW